jgi:hypothetical protein
VDLRARRLVVELDALALWRSYGTAEGDFRLLGQPEAAYLQGFLPGSRG